MQTVRCGFGGGIWTSFYLLWKAYLNLPAVTSLTQISLKFTFFQIIGEVTRGATITCDRNFPNLRGFGETSKGLWVRVSFLNVSFYKFCVSAKLTLHWCLSKGWTNESFLHEATEVNDGTSWPNPYSCWDLASQFGFGFYDQTQVPLEIQGLHDQYLFYCSRGWM